MRILLTGAAGFIGYHTALVLLARGDDVVGLDNMNAYYDPTLKQHRLEKLKTIKGFSFIKGDILNKERLTQALQGHDAIAHFAAESHVDRSL